MLCTNALDDIVTRALFVHEIAGFSVLRSDWERLGEKDALRASPLLRAWRSAFRDYSWRDFLRRLTLLDETLLTTEASIEQFRENLETLLSKLSSEERKDDLPIETSIDSIQGIFRRYFVAQFFSTNTHLYEGHRKDLETDFDSIFKRWFLPTVESYCSEARTSSPETESTVLLSLFKSYPVLARLLLAKGHAWVNEQQIFYYRLQSDAKCAINSELLQHPSEIEVTRGGLSDPHHGNQSVRIVSYKNGKHILYKPKPVDPDVFFNRILFLANEALDSHLPTPKILAQDGYGWIEHVKACDLGQPSGRQIYDAGVLLGLLHITCTTDAHHENIIWTDSSICFVDCETVLQAKPLRATDNDFTTSIEKIFSDSCIRTGFVPSWSMNVRTSRAIDISGLSGFRSKTLRTQAKQYKARATTIPETPNASRSQFDYSSEHTNLLLDGFLDVCSLLENRKADILAMIIPHAQNLTTRYVFRATEVYDAVLTYATSPSNMKDGRQFSICIDLISRALIKDKDNEFSCFVLREEIASLLSLDIPKFYSRSESTDLFGSRGCHSDYFQCSGLQFMAERFEKLSFDSLKVEREILVGLIAASSDDAEAPRVHNVRRDPSHDVTPAPHPDYEARPPTGAALQIAYSILHRQATIGNYDWWTFGFSPKTGRYQFSPIGANLYDGRSGIALLFGALAAEGYSDFELHARETFQTVASLLFRLNSTELGDIASSIGVGGIAGVGSMIYAGVRLSSYLGDTHYLDASLSAAHKIPREIIIVDQGIDIVTGNAGFILAMLRLYEYTDDRVAKELATLAGESLLMNIDNRLSHPHLLSPGTWHPLQLTGFSHGLAGIAYALVELHRSTGREDFLNGGKIAFCMEQALRLSDGSYPDLRFDNEELIHSSPNSWCHGLSGIVQSHVLISKYFPSEIGVKSTLREDVLELRTSSRKKLDHICCGEAGIVDALVTVFEVTHEWQLLREAREKMLRVESDASSAGEYSLNPQIPPSFRSVGFFQGLAGIAYEHLRVSSPNAHPSVSMLR